MEITLIVLFVLVTLLLNLVIVLQPGKGSGMGALGGGGGGAMGGGASSVFGARGASTSPPRSSSRSRANARTTRDSR